MSGHIAESYSSYVVATTATPFTTAQLPGGVAEGVFIAITQAGGITLTGLNGVDVAFGNQVLGTYLKFRCTKATFGTANGVIAYA